MADIIWDYRPLYVYAQTPKERFAIIEERYAAFVRALDEVSTDPVKVFDPLQERQLTELQLIREVSQVLQAKKNEDIRKSQAAAEAVDDQPQAEKDAEVTAETEEDPKTKA